jgi:putative redox protein
MGYSSAMAGTTSVQVRHEGGDRFAVAMRGHVVHVDQPSEDGGEDTGPTPTELLVASLASCIAFYARRYLRRHGLDETGLSVAASAEMGSSPARIARMTVTLELPADFPAERRPALLAVASACTVHNTLMTPPEVAVVLAPAAG